MEVPESWLEKKKNKERKTTSANFGRVSEVVKKGQISFAQQAVDHISEWSGNNLFQLNREKTKELVISFSHASPQFPPVTMDGGLIEVTEKAKLRGVLLTTVWPGTIM